MSKVTKGPTPIHSDTITPSTGTAEKEPSQGQGQGQGQGGGGSLSGAEMPHHQ